MLSKDILKPSAQAWLQQVKKLAVPLELVCSEGHLRSVVGTISRQVR